MINKTAREHCKSLHRKCFAGRIQTPQHYPQWRKCGGYIVLVNINGYVNPEHIFAIEIYNNIPEIHAYERKNEAKRNNCIAYSTLSRLLNNKEFSSKKIDFEEISRRVKAIYPDAYVPDPSAFCIEYGVEYKYKTHEMVNYVGCMDDREE